MGKLYRKTPGGTWYGDWRTLDGQRHRTCLRTKDKQVAQQRLRKLELDGAPAGVSSNSAATLRDALQHYCDDGLAGRPDGTKRSYRHKAGHLVRLMGDRRLGQLGKDDFTTYVRQRLADGASNSTVHKELTVLRCALRDAFERGVLKQDLRTIVPKIKVQYIPKARWLTRDEFRRLLDATPKHRQLHLLLPVYTGAEAGALERLQWEHVDLERGWMRIPGRKRDSRHRLVPIHPELLPHLQRVHRESMEEGAERADPVLYPWASVRRDLALYAKKAGIEHLTLTDLRRTFASWLKQAGVDSSAVAALMGHSSTTMVERVYGRLSEETLRGAISRLLPRDQGSAGDTATGASGESGTAELVALVKELIARLPAK
jgi:integrase